LKPGRRGRTRNPEPRGQRPQGSNGIHSRTASSTPASTKRAAASRAQTLSGSRTSTGMSSGRSARNTRSSLTFTGLDSSRAAGFQGRHAARPRPCFSSHWRASPGPAIPTQESGPRLCIRAPHEPPLKRHVCDTALPRSATVAAAPGRLPAAWSWAPCEKASSPVQPGLDFRLSQLISPQHSCQGAPSLLLLRNTLNVATLLHAGRAACGATVQRVPHLAAVTKGQHAIPWGLRSQR
jgi:hypothetical protein